MEDPRFFYEHFTTAAFGVSGKSRKYLPFADADFYDAKEKHPEEYAITIKHALMFLVHSCPQHEDKIKGAIKRLEQDQSLQTADMVLGEMSKILKL